MLEQALKLRLLSLVAEGNKLAATPLANRISGNCTDDKIQRESRRVITAAQHACHLIFESPGAPYRERIDKLAKREHGYIIHQVAGEVALILQSLLDDDDQGLLKSVADVARAETFDDFLDHASAYLAEGRKQESGTIAGVVFEDTIKRLCRKLGLTVSKDQKLDSLISALLSNGELSGVKAKRARAAADIRNKAAHASWNEFDLDDVKHAIEFTHEIIAGKLS